MNLQTEGKSSFCYVSEEWLEFKKIQLKQSSYMRYYNILHLYLIPEFGNREVRSITRNQVQSFCHQLLISGGIKGKGLSPKTINCIIAVMKSIFFYSSREKGLETSDISDVSAKQQPKTMRILSKTEQNRLSSYLCENLSPCHLGILLCLYTGLRLGEICALKWQDVLFDEKCLLINKSMQRIQTLSESESKTQIVVLPPKSSCSNRKIPIPNEVMKLLISYERDPNCYVLTGVSNRYIEPRNLENKFQSIVQKCMIAPINFHSLRHTFATRCIELNFEIKSLSEILGHSNVNITLNRYVHPSMELKQRNMDKLSSLLTNQ